MDLNVNRCLPPDIYYDLGAMRRLSSISDGARTASCRRTIILWLRSDRSGDELSGPKGSLFEPAGPAQGSPPVGAAGGKSCLA